MGFEFWDSKGQDFEFSNLVESWYIAAIDFAEVASAEVVDVAEV